MGERGPKLNKTERAVVELRIVRMKLDGYAQCEIARAVGLTDGHVSKVLKKYRAQCRKDAIEETEAIIWEHVAELKHMKRELAEAWRNSKGVKEIHESEGSGAGNKDGRKAKIKREFRDGNPAYMRERRECIQEINKILGVYPAQRTELTGLDGGPIKVEHTERRDERGDIRDAFERLATDQGLSLDAARMCLIAFGMDGPDVEAVYKELTLSEHERGRDAV